jgi:enterochelin esterase-like enzyme
MLRNRPSLPPIRFDCGTEDSLIESNRQLHRQLLAEKIPHTYQEFTGAHDWNYWQMHIAETLLFFGACLK